MQEKKDTEKETKTQQENRWYASGISCLLFRERQDAGQTGRRNRQYKTRTVQDTFGGLVTLNLYHNAFMNSGFPPHYDPHNLLIAQLCGSKVWRLAPPTQQYPSSFNPNHPQKESAFTNTFVLNEGDLLYIPWGWWHKAEPQETSIHMSVGIRNMPLFELKAQFAPK